VGVIDNEAEGVKDGVEVTVEAGVGEGASPPYTKNVGTLNDPDGVVVGVIDGV